jgi:signal transduction histidine kinase
LVSIGIILKYKFDDFGQFLLCFLWSKPSSLIKNIVYSMAILFAPIQDIIWNKLKNEYDIIYNAVQCSFKAIYILWLWLDSSKYFDE